MALLNFKKRDAADKAPVNPTVEAFLQGYSIEVMPRTAEKIDNFRDLLPEGTRVYIAHIEGTPIDDMVKTAKRIAAEGYTGHAAFPGADHQGCGDAGKLDRDVSGRGRR